MTYAVLTERKWHVLGITADLDPDRAELTENLSDCNLKCLVGFRLKKTSKILSGGTETSWKRTYLATKTQQAGGKIA